MLTKHVSRLARTRIDILAAIDLLPTRPVPTALCAAPRYSRLVSLEKPEHLRPADSSGSSWLASRPAGFVAAVLGLLAFIVVAMSQTQLWSTPDWRISVPAFVITAAAACVSVARRERGAYPLWLLGIGLAGSALVLGWFLMVAIVVGATAILMLILHAVM